MDARWTEEDNQTCDQELWLLSAAVGQDAGIGYLKRVKFSTNMNVIGFKWHRTDTLIWILGYPTLYLTQQKSFRVVLHLTIEAHLIFIVNDQPLF